MFLFSLSNVLCKFQQKIIEKLSITSWKSPTSYLLFKKRRIDRKPFQATQLQIDLLYRHKKLPLITNYFKKHLLPYPMTRRGTFYHWCSNTHVPFKWSRNCSHDFQEEKNCPICLLEMPHPDFGYICQDARGRVGHSKCTPPYMPAIRGFKSCFLSMCGVYGSARP